LHVNFTDDLTAWGWLHATMEGALSSEAAAAPSAPATATASGFFHPGESDVLLELGEEI
jgi:hypothetical protein